MTEQPCAHCGKPVLDGGVREWTGPASIPARTWHLDCEPCAGCGGRPVIYRNFAEQPLCAHCSECSCSTVPCSAPRPEQPVRHTADTINDAALDELYAKHDANERRALAYGMAWKAVEERAKQAEAAVARVRNVLHRIERARHELHGITEPQATGYRNGLNDAEQALHAALDGPKEPTP